MKKVILGLALCLACSSAFAQSAILYDYVQAGTISSLVNPTTIKVSAVLTTNIATGEKDGYLSFITKEGEGHIFLDEIPTILEMFNYAQDNLVGIKPKTEPKLDYLSKDDCRIGVLYSSLTGWTIYCVPHDLASMMSSVNANNIPKIITYIQDSEAKVRSHIASD